MSTPAGASNARRPGRRPTLYDVAADAGVSPMSVSRVLNEHPDVSSDMRQRVQRSVKKLGYRRNENARSLRPGQHTGLVGVVVTNIDNPYYAQVLLGIEDALDAQGLRIIVGMSRNEAGRERALVHDFLGRQVEGLIVVPTEGDDAFLTKANLGAIPIVFASREQPLVAADTVVLDDRKGTRQGVTRLIAKGHRRIAFLGNSATVSTSNRRFEGYSSALREAGICLDPLLIDRTCHDRESAEEAAARLVELPDPPTAMFCTSNQVTVGALAVAVPLRRTSPDRRAVEILGVDDFSLWGLIEHPLMIIDHDARALGRAAAHLLLRRLGSGWGDPPATLVLPTHLREQPAENVPG